MHLLKATTCAFTVLVFIFSPSNAIDQEFKKHVIREMLKVGEKCLAETKASKADLESLMVHEIPQSQEGKCLIFCIHRGFNMQNEDGSINVEGTMAAFQPLKEHDPEVWAKVKTVLDGCSSVARDSDPCVYATALAECSFKGAKESGLTDMMLE